MCIIVIIMLLLLFCDHDPVKCYCMIAYYYSCGVVGYILNHILVSSLILNLKVLSLFMYWVETKISGAVPIKLLNSGPSGFSAIVMQKLQIKFM